MRTPLIGLAGLALACTLISPISAAAQARHKKAYQLFTGKGRTTHYDKLLEAAAGADIVLFGEYHNNPISHWLQLELTRDLHGKRQLVLGAEMFERDNQEALDRYLRGELTAKGLDSAARLWNNYKTDYAPLENFARDKGLPFIATNVLRRYAALVSRQGFGALDTLPDTAKAWLPALPIAYDASLPGYQRMLTMMGGHGGENLPKAQAIKDATMAEAILKHHKPGSLFVHYHGAYHSDHYEGILWYLRQAKPGLRVVTISTVSQASLRRLDAEHNRRADFIIAVDEDMTTTY